MSAEEQQTYKITIKGPGHSFEKDVDAVIATKLITLAITGKVETDVIAGTVNGAGVGGSNAGSRPVVRGSLASHIKAKKADSNQTLRFLATAHWLMSRDEGPLTASAVAKALSDHHQKGLSNPADCLNKNVTKGFCEKRKDGSFFITPEGLESLDGAVAE